MLEIFTEFREKLDKVMVQAFGKRIVLYGYGYTGQFLEWYANYYHSLKIDFIISDEWNSKIPYTFPVFRESLFDFDYMDVKDAIVWVAVPMEDKIKEMLESKGYVENKTYYSFVNMIYGDNYLNNVQTSTDVFFRKKTGSRDVQFMEYLEHVYGCNFVMAISKDNFADKVNYAHSYRITTQKEIFPILDKCHCIPSNEDAIFDFGCGKGGALISFLDYGFKHVGGVEYEERIYETLIDNLTRLNMKDKVICYRGNAADMDVELDAYNWFYFFDPFDRPLFERVIGHICDSIVRYPRKVNIININPKYHQVIIDSGKFILTNQFCVEMRQKVVDIFVSI